MMCGPLTVNGRFTGTCRLQDSKNKGKIMNLILSSDDRLHGTKARHVPRGSHGGSYSHYGLLSCDTT
jgi:hypothetical protein